MRNINANKLFGALVSASIIVALVLGMYVALWPVDVLQNWTLTTDKDTYQTNETVIVTTRFDKVRNVTGISKRYIECETRNESINRIPISEGEANRSVQTKANNAIYLRIPSNIAELPSTCHIEIVVEYNIYTFRKHTESTKTPSFVVNQAKEAQEPTVDTPDTDNQVVENSPSNSQTQARNLPQPNLGVAETSPEYIEESPIVPPQNALCSIDGVNLVLGIVDFITPGRIC